MQESIIKIIANILSVSESEITADSDIVESLGADSIDIIEIISEIEESQGITIPDEVIPDFRFISDIVKYIESNSN